MYDIDFIGAYRLLDVAWRGLLTSSEIRIYAAECRAILGSVDVKDGYFCRLTFVDGQPLPQDSLDTLAQAFVGFPQPRRSAMVTSSAIARLQIKRVLMTANMQIFRNPDDALIWLRSA